MEEKKIIKKECERCGATENLVLHHPHLKPNWNRVWNQIETNLFVKSKYYKKERYKVKVCPNCEYRSFYKRKRKTPKYRCKKCYAEFEKPKRMVSLVWKDSEYQEDRTKFVKENREEITKQFSKYYEKYMSLKETITLCRKCHVIVEMRSKRLNLKKPLNLI